MPPATPMDGCIGCCGVTTPIRSTRTTRSSSTRRKTAKALEYCKALSDTFIPGVASWNDGSNNKAYLAGELYCTANGISIYVAAKDDPKMKDLTEDTYHALMPVGPIGKPTELQLCVPILAFNFTKYPNAAKAFIAFMLEKENFEKWLSGARGYLTQTLNAYDSAPVWTADPKNAVFGQASKRALPASGICVHPTVSGVSFAAIARKRSSSARHSWVAVAVSPRQARRDCVGVKRHAGRRMSRSGDAWVGSAIALTISCSRTAGPGHGGNWLGTRGKYILFALESAMAVGNGYPFASGPSSLAN